MSPQVRLIRIRAFHNAETRTQQLTACTAAIRSPSLHHTTLKIKSAFHLTHVRNSVQRPTEMALPACLCSTNWHWVLLLHIVHGGAANTLQQHTHTHYTCVPSCLDGAEQDNMS
eukprot:jgi/Ulvmu1/9833/UM056_0074.1